MMDEEFENIFLNRVPEIKTSSGGNWVPDNLFWQSQLGRAFLKYETKLGIATRAPEGKEANEAWQLCHDERHKFLELIAQQNQALLGTENYIRQLERDNANLVNSLKGCEAFAKSLAEQCDALRKI